MENSEYIILDGKSHFTIYQIHSSNYRPYLTAEQLAHNYIQLFSMACDAVILKSNPDISDVHILWEYLHMPDPIKIDSEINEKFKNDMTNFKTEAALLFYYQLLTLNLLDSYRRVPTSLYHKETTLSYHILGGYTPHGQ